MKLRTTARGVAAACLVLAGTTALASGCGSDDDSGGGGSATAESKPTQVSLRLPFAANGADAPYYYAKAQGLYEREGLDVEIHESSGSVETLTDVQSGGSQFGEVTGSNAMVAVSKGQPLEAVATPLAKNSFGFFVPEDSGIDSISDLKGRSVASVAAQGTNMAAALTAAGLAKGDVKPVVADPTSLIPTYLSGKVDAIYTTALLAPGVQGRKPTRVLLQSDVGFNPPDFTLIVKDSTLRDQPDLVRSFTRASLQGWLDAKRDPEAAVDALLAEHPEVTKPIGLGTLKATFDHYCSEAQAGEPYGFNAAADWSGAAKALELPDAADGSRFFTNELFEGPDAISDRKC